jgi:hypothetical protein
VIVDLEHPESELVAPPSLIFDEVELVDQRSDRRLDAIKEVDVSAPRLEVRSASAGHSSDTAHHRAADGVSDALNR